MITCQSLNARVLGRFGREHHGLHMDTGYGQSLTLVLLEGGRVMSVVPLIRAVGIVHSAFI